MELKLNIWKNQFEIEKTYTADTYDVMFGTVEDLMNMLDLEAFTSGNTQCLIAATGKLVEGSRELLKPLLKDIFHGVTDDELRHVKAKELLVIVCAITGFSLDEIKTLYATGKKTLEGKRTG